MCNCNDPTLSPAANSAKCWSIAGLIIGILGCLNFINGVSGAAGGAAGVLFIVSASMIMCCTKADNANCMFKAATVIMIINLILNVVSIALFAVALAGTQSVSNQIQGPNSQGSSIFQAVVGFALTWLYVSIGICAVVTIYAAICTYKYCKAIGSSPASGAAA